MEENFPSKPSPTTAYHTYWAQKAEGIVAAVSTELPLRLFLVLCSQDIYLSIHKYLYISIY